MSDSQSLKRATSEPNKHIEGGRAARGKITQVSSILSDLKNENKELITENDALIAENDDLRNKLDNLKNQGSSANADAAEKIRQMEYAHTKFLTDLGREHGEKLNQINASHAADMTACRKEIEPVKADLNAAIQELETLKRQLQQERDNNNANMSALGTQQASLNANAQAMFDQQLAQLKQQLMDSQTEVAELRRLLEVTQKAGSDGDAAASAAAAAQKQLEDEIAKLKQQLSDSQKTAKEDKATFATLSTNMEKEIEDLKAQLAAAKAKLDAEQAAGNAAGAAASEAAAAAAAAAAEIAGLKDQLATAQAEITSLKAQLAQALQENADLKAKLAAMEKDLASLRGELTTQLNNEKQSSANALSSEKDQSASSLQSLQQQLGASHAQQKKDWELAMAELRRKLAELQSKYDATIAAFEKAKADALKADADAANRRNAEEAAAHEAAMDAMKRRWQRQIQELEECHEKELAALKTVISAMPNASKHIRDAENLINSLKGTHRATAHMFQSMER